MKTVDDDNQNPYTQLGEIISSDGPAMSLPCEYLQLGLLMIHRGVAEAASPSQ